MYLLKCLETLSYKAYINKSGKLMYYLRIRKTVSQIFVDVINLNNNKTPVIFNLK